MTLEAFLKLTPRTVHFLLGAASEGIRQEHEFDAALHGTKLKPVDKPMEMVMGVDDGAVARAVQEALMKRPKKPQ